MRVILAVRVRTYHETGDNLVVFYTEPATLPTKSTVRIDGMVALGRSICVVVKVLEHEVVLSESSA